MPNVNQQTVAGSTDSAELSPQVGPGPKKNDYVTFNRFKLFATVNVVPARAPVLDRCAGSAQSHLPLRSKLPRLDAAFEGLPGAPPAETLDSLRLINVCAPYPHCRSEVNPGASVPGKHLGSPALSAPGLSILPRLVTACGS